MIHGFVAFLLGVVLELLLCDLHFAFVCTHTNICIYQISYLMGITIIELSFNSNGILDGISGNPEFSSLTFLFLITAPSDVL